MEIKFSIPFIRDCRTIKRILETNRIHEVYAGARDLDAVGLDRFKDIIKIINDHNINFSFSVTKRDGNKKIDLDSFPKQKLIIDDLNLLDKSNDKIYLSTIFGFRSNKDIAKIIQLKEKYQNITDICLHHDVIFDKNLKEKVKVLRQANIEPIVLVNESCTPDCKYRESHYRLHGVNKIKDYFQEECVKRREQNPEQLINLTGFIHPKQISKFSEETSVKRFKIAGRGKSPEWIKRTVNAYIALEIPNNLLDIIVYTDARDKFYVSSKAIETVELHKLTRNQVINLGKGFVKAKDIVVKNISSEILKWDKVYSKEVLPWYDIPFPEEVNKFFKHINKNQTILITGCGTGETANKIHRLGFSVKGTDISTVAIKKASDNFPHLEFYQGRTEDLGYNNLIVFDWLNLHQIKDIGPYLRKISKISNKLLITYLYEPMEKERNSIINDGKVYYHNPLIVSSYIDMKKVSEFKFSFIENSKYGSKRNTIGQIYEKIISK